MHIAQKKQFIVRNTCKVVSLTNQKKLLRVWFAENTSKWWQKILATNVTGNCWCDSFKIGIEKILSLARLLESTIADKIYETMSRNQAKLDRIRKLWNLLLRNFWPLVPIISLWFCEYVRRTSVHYSKTFSWC